MTSNRRSAPGSEQFSWSHNWPHHRDCDYCGKTLRVQDVGEHRTYYENGKAVKHLIWCSEHRGLDPFLPIGHPTC